MLALYRLWKQAELAETAGNAENHVAETQGMESFLRTVERRGFLMARTALRNEDDAFDVVQDSMLRLVQRYAARPPEEWRPLFYRILRNCINDVRRKRQINARLFGWLGRNEDDGDPIDDLPAPPSSDPAAAVAGEQRAAALMNAVQRLPARQQEAFMLRCWEGLSTIETAAAMGCSEGSVKTHYSRAVHVLRQELEGYWP